MDNTDIIEMFYDDGIRHFIEWRLNKRSHKLGGPAVIYYYENGKVKSEYWCQYGDMKRDDGPAHTDYDTHGNLVNEYWFINNKRLDIKTTCDIKWPITLDEQIEMKLKYG